MSSSELKKYKSEIIFIARDLRYGEEVIEKIKNAKTDTEISNIMKSARNNSN